MSALRQDAQPSQLESLLVQISDNMQLQNLLANLPDRTRRSVMVPFGSVAFFLGQLVHTNECFVDMGEPGCATDDGDFERMMARFDDLEKQEAATHNGAVAADGLDTTAHPSHVQQASAVHQPQLEAASAVPASKPIPGGMHHIKPPTGLKQGFLTSKASPSKATTRQAAAASSAGQDLCQVGEAQLQHNGTYQTSQPAFTGSVIERVDLPEESQASRGSQASTRSQATSEALGPVQPSSSGMSTGGQMAASSQPAKNGPVRRLSKFKQSRNAS
ncbi:hypothetical protein ABBQ38_014915 [Trebouxia sp. C0009 RCD-2024]